MKLIRWVVGRILLLLDRLTAPVGIERGAEEQKMIDGKFAHHSLYQFEACPFCIKVRRFLQAQSIALPLRDATREPFRGELVKNGGKLQVPCLKIEREGKAEWLYESSDIISYLQKSIGLQA